ncbi:hypothetical protein GQ457_13G006720 [Hibiscus cannabinus]
MYIGCPNALVSPQGTNCWNGAMRNLSMNDDLFYGQRNTMNWNSGRGELNFHGSPRIIQANRNASVQNMLNQGLPLSDRLRRAHSKVGIPCEDSFIIQGDGLNFVINKGLDCSRGLNKGSHQEIGVSKHRDGRFQLDNWYNFAAACGNPKLHNSFSLPSKCNLLAEAKLKLLEVCNEEQRMQILLMVTEEPGQLLIETLKTRQQISLVISALEPGFLSLIKDLNGNHVVQHCLQCLSSEDNKFIFVAAAKYCVDIATHQHGCCVLQRCISHSSGEYREKLVEQISSNGLLLAQDAYGNYVVQFILELKIPSATSTLISQFEGHYVHLSSQKFSSHVVEKCLVVLNAECRSKIIHELLSTTHFERLLQDPHANYVVQTALRVSEGPLHNSLVEAIESHKALSRNSPYSKRILSQKLLKK